MSGMSCQSGCFTIKFYCFKFIHFRSLSSTAVVSPSDSTEATAAAAAAEAFSPFWCHTPAAMTPHIHHGAKTGGQGQFLAEMEMPL